MKYVISVVLLLVTTLAFASAGEFSSIVVTTDSGTQVKIEWLETEVDESEVEVAWEQGGQSALYLGNLCFNGNPNDIANILNSMSDSDFLGDEYRIQNIDTSVEGQISYEVYDGPNEMISNEVTITTCK